VRMALRAASYAWCVWLFSLLSFYSSALSPPYPRQVKMCLTVVARQKGPSREPGTTVRHIFCP